MERARIRETFDRLYEGVEGYKLSHQERDRLASEDKSLIYGEVLADGFLDVMAQVEPRPDEIFYDLGSGTGRAVLLAAMAFPFRRLVGIEYLATLHEAAERIHARFEAEVRPALTAEGLDPRVELRQGDFLEADFSDANFVFMQSNCFQPPLLKALVDRFEQLAPGTRIVALGQLLKAPHLAFVKSAPCTLGWGESFFALYRRR